MKPVVGAFTVPFNSIGNLTKPWIRNSLGIMNHLTWATNFELMWNKQLGSRFLLKNFTFASLSLLRAAAGLRQAPINHPPAPAPKGATLIHKQKGWKLAQIFASKQCEQMSWSALAIYKNENLHNSIQKFCQSRFKIMPNTKQMLKIFSRFR